MVLELRFSDSRLNLLPTPPQGLFSVLLHANNHRFLPPTTQQAHREGWPRILGRGWGKQGHWEEASYRAGHPESDVSMSLEMWKHLTTIQMVHGARDGVLGSLNPGLHALLCT